MYQVNGKPFSLSFEFFPPKTAGGVDKLAQTQALFDHYQPDYYSVTYGAGGSTRERTLKTVLACQENSQARVTPHLACVGDTQGHLVDLMDYYKQHKIDSIVALRGDLPSGVGPGSGEINYASDLVRLIRAETGDYFHIAVAAYPEIHPQASSPHEDLQYFVEKVNAGADSAITQYFYNADAYYDFMDRATKAGVTCPIYPGIMPITNFKNLVRFSDACGAEIPRWIRKQLEAYGEETDSIKAFGQTVVSRLCEQLIDLGAPGFHFYTLNQADPTLMLLKDLNLTPTTESSDKRLSRDARTHLTDRHAYEH